MEFVVKRIYSRPQCSAEAWTGGYDFFKGERGKASLHGVNSEHSGSNKVLKNQEPEQHICSQPAFHQTGVS